MVSLGEGKVGKLLEVYMVGMGEMRSERGFCRFGFRE